MPCTPQHRGNLERGVGYVKANALKERVFGRLRELKEHLRHLEAMVADKRIHSTTRQQVAEFAFRSVSAARARGIVAGRAREPRRFVQANSSSRSSEKERHPRCGVG
jgi:hypothetical protein